jgi:hypothetical protein
MKGNVKIKRYLIGTTAFYVRREGKKVEVRIKEVGRK